LKVLVENERPELIKTVAWAPPMATARKTPTTLREEAAARDRAPHPLSHEAPGSRRGVDFRGQDQERVFFGATVTYSDASGHEHTVSIVGTDEVDPARGAYPGCRPWPAPAQGAGGRRGDAQDARWRRRLEVWKSV